MWLASESWTPCSSRKSRRCRKYAKGSLSGVECHSKAWNSLRWEVRARFETTARDSCPTWLFSGRKATPAGALGGPRCGGIPAVHHLPTVESPLAGSFGQPLALHPLLAYYKTFLGEAYNYEYDPNYPMINSLFQSIKTRHKKLTRICTEHTSLISTDVLFQCPSDLIETSQDDSAAD